MGRAVRDHPANEDEADRHARSRRVPTIVTIAVAALTVVGLAYLRAKGVM
ncbi:MAG: hypothetical protein ABI231_07195 [Candidatus Tumulicola sp.]